MRCQNCKTEISGSPKFCPKCGGKVEAPPPQSEEAKICPQCGTENVLSAKFCKKDGYRFDTVAEVPITPTAPAMTMQASGEETPAIVPTKMPPADDSVICPKCGTPNLPNAKFCKKDGYALQVGVATPQAIPVPKSAPIKQPSDATAPSIGSGAKSHKGLAKGLIIGVVLLAGAAGGIYWYYTHTDAYIAYRQRGAQALINDEITRLGMSNIKVTVDQDWVATLSGSLLNQSEKDQALGVAKNHADLKKIVDEIQIQADPMAAQNLLRKSLAEAGLGALSAQVDKDLVATLTGAAENQEQKTQALKLANGVTGIKRVVDDIQVITVEVAPQAVPSAPVPPVPAAPTPPPASVPQPSVKMGPPQRPQPAAIDPAKLEGDINRALRSQNVNGVSAQVGDDLSVTLKGSGSASEKGRAIQVVRQFREVRAVKDKIFVVE